MGHCFMEGCLRYLEVFHPDSQKQSSQLLGKTHEQILSYVEHQECAGTETKMWLAKGVGRGEKIGKGDTK